MALSLNAIENKLQTASAKASEKLNQLPSDTNLINTIAAQIFAKLSSSLQNRIESDPQFSPTSESPFTFVHTYGTSMFPFSSQLLDYWHKVGQICHNELSAIDFLSGDYVPAETYYLNNTPDKYLDRLNLRDQMAGINKLFFTAVAKHLQPKLDELVSNSKWTYRIEFKTLHTTKQERVIEKHFWKDKEVIQTTNTWDFECLNVVFYKKRESDSPTAERQIIQCPPRVVGSMDDHEFFSRLHPIGRRHTLEIAGKV